MFLVFKILFYNSFYNKGCQLFDNSLISLFNQSTTRKRGDTPTFLLALFAFRNISLRNIARASSSLLPFVQHRSLLFTCSRGILWEQALACLLVCNRPQMAIRQGRKEETAGLSQASILHWSGFAPHPWLHRIVITQILTPLRFS